MLSGREAVIGSLLVLSGKKDRHNVFPQASSLGMFQLFRTHMKTKLHICYICTRRPRPSLCIFGWLFIGVDSFGSPEEFLSP